MPKWIRIYVRVVDGVCRRLGVASMYLVFVMMAVLFYSAVSRSFTPSLWTLEVAQFLMVGYFLLGGAYSLQTGDHVRMDLLYGSWGEKRKLFADVVTALFLLAYLVVLLYGGVSSTWYAIETGERSYSVWRPYMWPIKVVMTFGILMMLLQSVSVLFRDLARLLGREI